MKSEAQANEVLWHYNQLSIPSLGPSAIAVSDADEISKLKVENARLQQLVAELLIANQNLRRHSFDSGRDTERGKPSVGSNPPRADN
jgi:hypothetical protein